MSLPRLTGTFVGWQTLVQLGGPGLILLGIVDQSFVPLPGSMDALTIVLAAGRPRAWLYFALMSTIGTVVGAYITYRISRKGGKETLRKKVPHRKIKKIEEKVSKHGFFAVFGSCLLPPPLPSVPFLVGAGALHYPTRKFLLAVVTGRALRYVVVAYFGHLYGDAILRFFSRYQVIIIIVFALLVLGATAGGFLLRKWQLRHQPQEPAKAGEADLAGADNVADNKDAGRAIPDPGLQIVPPPASREPRRRRAG